MLSRLSTRAYESTTLKFAEDLIGRLLVHETPDGAASGYIVETEAYIGPDDRGSHARGGLRSARTEVQYGPPGRAYVYRIYGMHSCFCVVTGGIGAPEVVLVRALEPFGGIDLMRVRREGASLRDLCRGPARACVALGIDHTMSGVNLVDGGSLYLAESADAPLRHVRTSERIRIDYAGEDRHLPWRFYDATSRFVSR